MSKPSMQLSAFGQDQTLFKNAFIWDTQMGTKLNDHRMAEESEVDKTDADELDRKIRGGDGHRKHWSRPDKCQKTNINVIDDNDELSRLWTHFASQTTFHGVKNIVSQDKRRQSRCLWLLIVVGMSAGMLYTVAVLLLEYYQYNTITKSDVKIYQEAIFPSVTLCNTCPYKNIEGRRDSPLFKMFASQAIFFKGRFTLNFSDPDVLSLLSLDILEFQDRHSFSATDMFFNVQYENVDLNVSEDFEVTETVQGRCFTFNGPEYIAKNGPRWATFDGRESGLRLIVKLHQDKYFAFGDLTAGLRIFVSHHPDTPRLQQDGIDIHPGTSSRLALDTVKYTFLPAPFKSYGDESCMQIDVNDFVHKMVNASFYSYFNCLEQCYSYKASVTCACYTMLLYSHRLQKKQGGSTRRADVPNLRRCTVSDVGSCFAPARGNITADECDCPRSCSTTRYESTVSASQLPSSVSSEFLRNLINASSEEEIRDEYLELRIYLNTMMLRHEQHESQYNFSSIFAFLGGQMGFFLGASLISLAELFETIIFSGYILIRKMCMRMRHCKTTAIATTTPNLTSKPHSKRNNTCSIH